MFAILLILLGSVIVVSMWPPPRCEHGFPDHKNPGIECWECLRQAPGPLNRQESALRVAESALEHVVAGEPLPQKEFEEALSFVRAALKENE